MMEIQKALGRHPQVSDYKIKQVEKKSSELFFVKGVLETVRSTDTCDREVTVYVRHGEFMGDSKFFVYPSTTAEELDSLIDQAAAKAALIDNKPYSLPGKEVGEYAVESNFEGKPLSEIAAIISNAVFDAEIPENGSLNAVEVFANRLTETVVNSNGLQKSQVRYTAMAEVIPTYNGETQSVELYEQENFNTLDAQGLKNLVTEKLREVQARYSAEKPAKALSCPVVFHAQELGGLMRTLISNTNYASVYKHSNLYSKGDAVQSDPKGDKLTLTMAGTVPGNVRSLCFDDDGLTLGEKTVIENGVVTGYYGDNRFGQYLGENPTGNLPCCIAAPGSWTEMPETYLEILSMSGLQSDCYTDYLGGEIRLAYYHDGKSVTPVTGISVSGKLSEALNNIRLSKETASHGGYTGPAMAMVDSLSIF